MRVQEGKTAINGGLEKNYSTETGNEWKVDSEEVGERDHWDMIKREETKKARQDKKGTFFFRSRTDK